MNPLGRAGHSKHARVQEPGPQVVPHQAPPARHQVPPLVQGAPSSSTPPTHSKCRPPPVPCFVGIALTRAMYVCTRRLSWYLRRRSPRTRTRITWTSTICACAWNGSVSATQSPLLAAARRPVHAPHQTPTTLLVPTNTGGIMEEIDGRTKTTEAKNMLRLLQERFIFNPEDVRPSPCPLP